jgi:hypothetical protein
MPPREKWEAKRDWCSAQSIPSQQPARKRLLRLRSPSGLLSMIVAWPAPVQVRDLLSWSYPRIDKPKRWHRVAVKQIL